MEHLPKSHFSGILPYLCHYVKNMKEYFKYFKGKPCTISTVQINFRFKEEQMMDYFMGIVENIDENGIWILHPVTKCRSYVLFPHIVSISEEQVLYENNPEHAKIIEEYRQEKPITATKSAFVNPAALAEIAKKAKAAFHQEKLNESAKP